MATAPYSGLRSVADFSVTGQRPENFREKILQLYPNGDMPLTGFLASCKSEKTSDPKFHWFQRVLPKQRAEGTAGAFVYEDAALSDAVDSGDSNAAGSMVWVKTTALYAKEFRPGHEVLLRDADNYTRDVRGVVTDVLINGDSSRVSVKLIQAAAAAALNACDTMLVIGNANAEGADRTDSITYDPEEKNNNCQIFRTSLDMTRTAMQTQLRTGDPYRDAKDLAAEFHALEMEKAFIYGYGYSDVGSNGKPRRFTQGIIAAITADASGNVSDYSTATTISDSVAPSESFDGFTWVQKGAKWLNLMLEKKFRYGSRDGALCFCGSGALAGIQELAEAGSFITLQPGAKAYGLDVTKWITPFGTINLRVHPLFSHEPTNRNSILVVEPRNLRYRFVQDTIFKKDNNWREGGSTSVDGLSEEFLTECGLEYHFPETMLYLNGVGLDNAA